MNIKYFKVKSLYNHTTQFYAEKSAVLLHEQLSYFLSYIPKKSKILDIGCGPGHDTEYFSKKGFEAIGIDFSSKMIEFSKKNRRCGVFKNMNMLDIEEKFPKNYFDGIWISSSLTHLENVDIIRLLKQVRSILVKNGTIAVIVKKRMKKNIEFREVLFRQFYKKEIINFVKVSKFAFIKMDEFEALNKKWLFIIAKKRA